MEKYPHPYDGFIRKHLQYYGYFSQTKFQPKICPQKLQQYHYDLFFLWGRNNQITSFESKSSKAELVNEVIQEFHSKSLEIDNDDCTKDANLQTTQLTYSVESGNKIPILKKPRNLYVLPSDLGINVGVRWPIELQVLPYQVHHIPTYPLYPETFSIPSLLDLQVQLNTQTKKDKVVFSYPIVVGSSFVRSYIAGVNTVEENYAQRTTHHSTLIFESRFESGNLCKAIQIEEYSYELYIRPDLYAPYHAQWFYFQVKNMHSSQSYKFSIVNLSKPSNLYCCGMKPLMYSERHAEKTGIGWLRVGDNVSHIKNSSDCEEGMYTLMWTQQFPYDDDTVYFAYSYPYTYSDLQEYLTDLMHDPLKVQYCHIRVLCRTLAGNNVYVVTVTSPETLPLKKVIVLTARVHPGESVSSWVMKGFLDFITGHTGVAQNLRRHFIFKLVPMLNPDGVIVGNHRCSLSGCDLNRSYRTMFKETFPPSWHVRRLIRKLLDEYEVAMYCDIHGHGQLQNMFMYGCENPMSSSNYLLEQLFPLLLHRQAPDLFSFQQCRFNIQRSREGTGRVVMWVMGIPLSYTLEVSFAGSNLGEKAGTHFTPVDYEQIAAHFCYVLVDYFDQRKSKILAFMAVIITTSVEGKWIICIRTSNPKINRRF